MECLGEPVELDRLCLLGCTEKDCAVVQPVREVPEEERLADAAMARHDQQLRSSASGSLARLRKRPHLGDAIMQGREGHRDSNTFVLHRQCSSSDQVGT